METLATGIVVVKPTPEEIAAQKVIEDRKPVARKKLRYERDTLINTTDKYAMRDYPINDETFKKWKRYRQHLRDLPGMSSPDLDEDGNLTGVEWPVAPIGKTENVVHQQLCTLMTENIELRSRVTLLESKLTQQNLDLSDLIRRTLLLET